MFSIPFKTTIPGYGEFTGLVGISLDDTIMPNCYGFESSGIYIGKYNQFATQASVKARFIFDSLPVAFSTFMNETFKGDGAYCVAALEIAKVGSSWETRLCCWNGNDFIPTIEYATIPTSKYRIVIKYVRSEYTANNNYSSWSGKSVQVRRAITGLIMPGNSQAIFLSDNNTFSKASGDWLSSNSVEIECFNITKHQIASVDEIRRVISLIGTSDPEIDTDFIKW